MKTNTGNSFQALLEKFFLQRLMKQKGASPETVKSYRDTFRLYIKYLDSCHSISPTSIMIEHLGAKYTLGFLDDLATSRNNGPRTINNRLAAIHAFLRFLSFEVSEYSSIISKNLMIPFRKEENRQMDFVSKEEFEALLRVCDTKTDLGCRDELMLLLLYNSGVRVSEMLGLHGRDIIWSTGSSIAYIHVTGKGRKERNIPLWKSTSKRLSLYMKAHKICSDTKLFINYSGEKLTRSGVRYRLQCLVNEAGKRTPSLKLKNISPHTFRHSTALHLLQSGVDISSIAIWLGHESIVTTHKYMEADMEMKRGILDKLSEPTGNSYHFKPDNTILAFLDSL